MERNKKMAKMSLEQRLDMAKLTSCRVLPDTFEKLEQATRNLGEGLLVSQMCTLNKLKYTVETKLIPSIENMASAEEL